MCKPVWETCVKEIPYTVCKPVWETCTKEICYTVCKPVYETREKVCHYTVCKPVWETCTKEICYTVCKPVYETCEREVCYTRVQAGMLHQDDQGLLRPLGNPLRWLLRAGVLRFVQLLRPLPAAVPRVGARDPRAADPVRPKYVPRDLREEGSLHRVPDGARAAREDLHLPGVPHGEGALREADPLHRVPDGARAARQDLLLQVCHMVPEQRVKTCCYQVCHMVPEQRVKTCCYQVCHMVQRTRQDLLLPGVQDGARAAREDLHLHRCARWCPSSA